MNSMKCWSCALKHLAGALSYGKEILSGHGFGSELDHRPDLIGELVNCEHHAELLNATLFDVVSTMRKRLQDHYGVCTPEDLDSIRQIYLTTERMEIASEKEQRALEANLSNIEPQKQSVAPTPLLPSKTLDDYPGNPEILDIVILNVENREWFDFQYQSIQQHADGYRKLIAVQPAISLSDYPDVHETQQSLYQLCQTVDLSDVFICMNGHQALLHNYRLQELPPTYAFRVLPSFQSTREELSAIYGSAYDYDSFIPQPVDKALFASSMSENDTTFPMSRYFMKKHEEKIYDTKLLGSYLDRPICCSTRASLRTLPFVSWQGTSQFTNLKAFAIDQQLIQNL